MKFSCGLTWEEYKSRRETWHSWFAWRPVTVSVNDQGRKQCVWLEWVSRKGTYSCNWADSQWDWEYKE
jgi:hypothetical protein